MSVGRGWRWVAEGAIWSSTLDFGRGSFEEIRIRFFFVVWAIEVGVARFGDVDCRFWEMFFLSRYLNVLAVGLEGRGVGLLFEVIAVDLRDFVLLLSGDVDGV